MFAKVKQYNIVNLRSFLLVLISAFLITSCSSQQNSRDQGTELKNVATISEATLVDVRVPEEFSGSPVKNAVNIPLAEIEHNLDFFRKQKQTVLFCNKGKQANEAYQKLRKNGIKNIQKAPTWKEALAMQNNIYNNVVFSKEKPSTFVVKKTDKIQQIAVALAEGTLLKKHITSVPTQLVVVKGSIVFKINNEDYTFIEGDTYDIPVNVEHEVVGKSAENLFILTKEL